MSEKGFNPHDPEFIQDPYSFYRRFHNEEPIVRSEHYGGFWLLTRYQDVRRALQDWETYSSATPGVTSIPMATQRDFPEYPIESDPPEHTKYRELVNPWFSKVRIVKFEPDIRRIANELIDRFINLGRADLIKDFAAPLVTRVLMLVVGLPESEAEKVNDWANVIMHGRLHDIQSAKRASSELIAYVDEIIASRRRAPQDDIFSLLTQATIDGRPLTDLEIRGYGVFLLMAGHETTIKGIGNSLWYLAAHPDDKERLINEPALITTAVEEFLRYMPPVHMLGRNAARDVEICGKQIKKGDLVAIGYGAANMDESVFEQAHTCRIDRRPNPHLSFGAGPHTCLGTHLARLEMCVAIEEVLRRIPNYQLDPSSPPERTPHGDLIGFWKLPVVFDNR
jgi:cytochrome P450